MQTLINIEENQLNKLLFYTQAKNEVEAVSKVIQDYLLKKENSSEASGYSVMIKKEQLLQDIQNRFSCIPEKVSLVDELITERHLESLEEMK